LVKLRRERLDVKEVTEELLESLEEELKQKKNKTLDLPGKANFGQGPG
jgi:hypothetical protein